MTNRIINFTESIVAKITKPQKSNLSRRARLLKDANQSDVLRLYIDIMDGLDDQLFTQLVKGGNLNGVRLYVKDLTNKK